MKSDQLKRYKNLINYIDANFKEDINIEKVEAISLYSYRNINRIFQALHQETIGKYVKRIRLEKAAQYLKYSNITISDIAFEVGYEDIAAFSKAFKKKYAYSPSDYRSSNHPFKQKAPLHLDTIDTDRQALTYELEYLPDFDFLGLEYRGAYDNLVAINTAWEQLVIYADQHQLLDDDPILIAEVLDDEEISENIHCRYNTGIILKEPLKFEPDGLFKLHHHQPQQYAKFIHKGPHEKSVATYNKIYANWMIDVKLEFKDLPTLEFFLNDEETTPPEELLTAIYIPVR